MTSKKPNTVVDSVIETVKPAENIKNLKSGCMHEIDDENLDEIFDSNNL